MVLSIGQLAEAAAVNIQTVRYYERLGLIAPPPRAKNRYRQYELATVRRLRSGYLHGGGGVRGFHRHVGARHGDGSAAHLRDDVRELPGNRTDRT